MLYDTFGALVEQASAAAAALQDEPATLAAVVSVFNMESEPARAVASMPQRKALPSWA